MSTPFRGPRPAPRELARAIAMSLAIASACAGTAVEASDAAALEARLRAIEARLGIAADDAAADPSAALDDLDQRLRILERRLEIQQEEATARAATTPAVAIGSRGLSVQSADKAFDLRLRGVVHADLRVFDDAPAGAADGFLFRRVRPSVEGTFGSWLAWRVTPELAGDATTLLDAWVDLRPDPRVTLRVGRQKSPVGLERLQSGSALALVERGFPTELAPNRDLGIAVLGEPAAGRVSYAFGLFNGTADGRDTTSANADGRPQLAGRVVFEPWKGGAGALAGLGFGLAATHGDAEGTGNAFLPRYRTPGQVVFFSYGSNVVADGRHTRWSPQLTWYHRNLGLEAEWIASKQTLVAGTRRERLEHRAGQLTGHWVLTGEDIGPRGLIPKRPWRPGSGGGGAWELVARIGTLDIDDAAFTGFADPARAATRAWSAGLGVNWAIDANLKWSLAHTRTRFDGGAPGGADRDDESVLFSRLQLAF